MKKQVIQTIQALVIVTTLVAMVACGNKGDNGVEDAAVVPYGINGCTNCGGITAPTEFLTLNSKGGNSMGGTQFNGLHFVGDANVLQQLYNSGYSPIASPYPLTVGLSGNVTVQSVFNSGSCRIPVGSYTINTIRAGQMVYGTVTGNNAGNYQGWPSIPLMQFEAIGPTRVLFGIQQGVVNGSRLYMKIWVLEGPGVAGNQIACQDGMGYFTTN